MSLRVFSPAKSLLPDLHKIGVNRVAYFFRLHRIPVLLGTLLPVVLLFASVFFNLLLVNSFSGSLMDFKSDLEAG